MEVTKMFKEAENGSKVDSVSVTSTTTPKSPWKVGWDGVTKYQFKRLNPYLVVIIHKNEGLVLQRHKEGQWFPPCTCGCQWIPYDELNLLANGRNLIFEKDIDEKKAFVWKVFRKNYYKDLPFTDLEIDLIEKG